jgi:hypothetical protein
VKKRWLPKLKSDVEKLRDLLNFFDNIETSLLPALQETPLEEVEQ